MQAGIKRTREDHGTAVDGTASSSTDDALPPMAKSLLHSITTTKACVGVVGLGYVGLPLLMTFARKGFRVIGFDINKTRIGLLSKGKCDIEHLEQPWQELHKEAKVFATSDPAGLGECDAVLLCVPTPLNQHMQPDLSYVMKAMETIMYTHKAGRLVVLESTTYPGTTEEELIPILKRAGADVGYDSFLAFSPEREDPGNKSFHMHLIPKLVGGTDGPSLAVAKALYSSAFDSVHAVSSCRVAEAAKIVENVYRAVNIALVNELKIVFDKMHVDIWEVLDAAETKPFGFHRFNPGPGWGGHCIPIDPFYLMYKARALGVDSHFIQRAGEINIRMPEFVVQKIVLALNDIQKAVKGSRILLLGVAYKPGIGDCRETPAFEIWHSLESMGAQVEYHDPFVPTIVDAHGKHAAIMGKHSYQLSACGIFDAIVIVTNQPNFGWNQLASFGGPVIDTRNCVPKHLGLKVYQA